MLIEVVILLEPTVEEANTGQLEKILVEPYCIVAKTAELAKYQALIDNADKLKGVEKNRLKVLARPF